MVTISVNGSPVGYTHQIQDGDVITITKEIMQKTGTKIVPVFNLLSC